MDRPTQTDSASAATPVAESVAPSVAVYWDFENLHARLVEDRQGDGAYNTPDGRFKAQEPLVQVQKLTDFAATLGPIAIHRAYCNWQYFGRYREALLGASIDLVQLFPPGASAKNGADIRLCLDAQEDSARFAHIAQFVIIGGDSDFMPLAQKLQASGRRVVGIGARKSTNRYWAGCCDAFYYYEDVVGV